MSNLKDIQQIQSLIAKGKGAGFLTFEEVNKALPVEMSTPEQFEEIIGIFEQLEIVIVDSEKDGKKISAAATETDEDITEGSLDLTADSSVASVSTGAGNDKTTLVNILHRIDDEVFYFIIGEGIEFTGTATGQHAIDTGIHEAVVEGMHIIVTYTFVRIHR